MKTNAMEVFEKIKSYEPYEDVVLNALVDLCELLNCGMITERDYFEKREHILRGEEA